MRHDYPYNHDARIINLKVAFQLEPHFFRCAPSVMTFQRQVVVKPLNAYVHLLDVLSSQ